MYYDFFGSIDPALKAKLVQSLFVFAILYTLKFLSVRLIVSKIEDSKARYRWTRAFSIFINTVLLVLIFRVWFEGVDSIATYFGFLTAGLAFALKDPIANMAGSAFIIYKKPFEIGDRIQVGSVQGDVVDISLFQFSILEIGSWVDADQATGRIVHIPSGQVFIEDQVNYNQAFSHIWNEISVLITFESDWKKAKTLLLEILKSDKFKLGAVTEKKLREASLKFMLPIHKFEPEIYTSIVKEKGINLTLRYLCPVNARRKTEVGIWERVLESFSEHSDIQFAYPTRRVYSSQPIEASEKTNPMST